MNQKCRVCGEPAAGFHFGAFTCEGCKSFFGRSYNNISSIAECKNNHDCTINKKNRTACKACRLRKCLLVGMSKSGSRYGRRSNWFKIHCLLQEQQQQVQQQQHQTINNMSQAMKPPQNTPPPLPHHPLGMSLLGMSLPPNLMHFQKAKEEMMLVGMDEYKHSTSPSVSSPESHNSDSSLEVNDARRLPMIPGLLPPHFLPPPGFMFPPGYPPLYPNLLPPASNNNNRFVVNHNYDVEAFNKRIYLDAVLQSQREASPEEQPVPTPRSPVQEDPIDLSMKSNSDRSTSPASEGTCSTDAGRGNGSEADEESEYDSDRDLNRLKGLRPTPLDLTRKSS